MLHVTVFTNSSACVCAPSATIKVYSALVCSGILVALPRCSEHCGQIYSKHAGKLEQKKEAVETECDVLKLST